MLLVNYEQGASHQLQQLQLVTPAHLGRLLIQKRLTMCIDPIHTMENFSFLSSALNRRNSLLIITQVCVTMNIFLTLIIKMCCSLLQLLQVLILILGRNHLWRTCLLNLLKRPETKLTYQITLLKAIQNMEVQISQMATTMKAMQKGTFSNCTKKNPREDCKAVTLRSGRNLARPILVE